MAGKKSLYALMFSSISCSHLQINSLVRPILQYTLTTKSHHHIDQEVRIKSLHHIHQKIKSHRNICQEMIQSLNNIQQQIKVYVAITQIA